ncbi:hypothetical protein INS49_000155 [Diaporthe citri]|uniref:uncharacterized protein n=1 Tax=Diaporthe citri TaxID=83186 RepID=UPI001C7F6244|nr:uncharacterized protein INS49_000155 [Diaporthe citri]KAG6365979.1 hypothetical protein INS49_000155 [Diaporthe citri]
MDLEELIGTLSSQVGISCDTDHRDSSFELSQSSTIKSDDARNLKRSDPSPDGIRRSKLATRSILRERNTAISTRLREIAQEYAEAWSEKEAEYGAKIGSLERRLYEQHETVESAKAAASLILEQNRSFTLSDDEVSRWLNTRARSWYEWAKEAAHRDFELVHEKYEEIHAHLKNFVVEQDGDIPEELWKTKPKRLPYPLLHGIVANFICTEIFKNPFWILDALPAGDESGGIPTGMQQAVAELNEVLLQLNTKNAHQWRAQLLRIFAMAGENPTLATCKARYADALTDKFLNSAARFCLKQEAEWRACERTNFLKDEISRALEFSLQLWAQRSRVDAVDLQMFHRHDLGKYVHCSELMEPHQSQRSEAPEDYHGRRMLMVVQPAIVAFGTEDGRDYDEISRVWLKARVLMGEPEGEISDAMLEN